MAYFVINEWIWHDAEGEHGLAHQLLVLRLFECLATTDHRIVVIEGSPFDHKAFARYTNPDQTVKRIARQYQLTVRFNSNCCRVLTTPDVAPLPEHLVSNFKDDDHYLVQAQLAIEGAIVVTTDGKLRTALLASDLPCISRDEFFQTYFPQIM